jgi:hypothetical protein
MQLLRDPFAKTPMQLGWGNMLPSTTFTSRASYIKSIGVGGSSLFMALPNVNSCLVEIDSSTASPCWTLRSPFPDTAAASFKAVFSQARPVAFGIMVRSLASANQSQPRLYCGYFTDSISELNSVAITGATCIASFINGSTARPADPLQSYTVCGLPMDPESFNYNENYLMATPPTLATTANTGLGFDYFAHSLPTIVVSNSDSSSVNVQIEYICHYEALPDNATGSALFQGTAPRAPPGANADSALSSAGSLIRDVGMGIPYVGGIAAANAIGVALANSAFTGQPLLPSFSRTRV